MADPRSYRPAAGSIPTQPGVYRFLDQADRVIYVGKAKNLRARLANYFGPLPGLHPRTQQMVTTATQVQWTVVGTEVEALGLEYTWIKEFAPRFNVMYRDDKSYPYLAVTMGETYPRVQVMRGDKQRGTRYFGPYTQVWAIRQTVDLLLKVFPVRSCSKSVFRRAQLADRPCLLGYIDKCSAPCVGRISEQDHRQLAQELCDFMAGTGTKQVKELTNQMRQAAAMQDYESAARLRDAAAALEQVMARNVVVLPDDTYADVFALERDALEAAVQVFYVRAGRITGQRGWIVEKTEELSDAALVEQLLGQVYGAADPEIAVDIPRELLVPVLPTNAEDLTTWLTGERGTKVRIRVPQRGDKRALMETVAENAKQALTLHRMKRSADLTTRSQALQELQDALGLDQAPLRIECFDISTTQGTHQMASMVVFEDGLPRTSEYRTYGIRGEHGDGARDDTAAIHEVISRRLAALNDGKSKYQPHLIVVDGGQPQVNAAWTAFQEAGVTDIALCGLAKRLEEVWLPDDDYPLILERGSQGLYLMQRVRDEAHRFAIKAHRRRRSGALTVSVLDEIPGLGTVKGAALVKHFGSVKRIRAAGVEQLRTAPGIGPKLAQTIYDFFHPAPAEDSHEPK